MDGLSSKKNDPVEKEDAELPRPRRWLRRVSLLLAACALIAVVAIVDTATGWEMDFSLFYLLPVALVSWFVSRAAGIVFSVACAIVWHFSEVKSGHVYAQPGIAYWNAAMQFGFFLVVCLALSALKRTLDKEK